MATRGGNYGRYDRDFYSGEGRRFAGGDYDTGGRPYRGDEFPGGAVRRVGDEQRHAEARDDYRGRGPRSFQRSDERIREDVCECLTDDPQIDASDLEVAVKACEVTLSGTVSSRRDKRHAERIAESVSGVKDVHNTLRISAPDESRADVSEKGEPSSPMSDMTATQTAKH